MASTGQNYIKDFTVNNQGITNLSELLFLTILQSGPLSDTMDMNFGIRQSQIVGGVGSFDPVGTSKSMCNPTYNNTNLAIKEKKWDLGNITIAERLCADDFVNTIAKWSMRTGNSKADLTGTDMMSIVIEPRLREQLEQALWRVLWFGNKDAATITGGGVIRDDVNVNLFNMADGFFKRLFAIAPTGSLQNTAIAANSEATFAAQRAAILVKGVATNIFDNLIYNADMRIRQGDRIIYCTQALADALARDIKANNIGSEGQWESLFDGLPYAIKYNGETIQPLPIWDDMIARFESSGTGATLALNKPFRAVFANKNNLMAGIESSEGLTSLNVWFSQDDQDVKILAREDVGTMIWEDDLIQFAY